MLLLLSARLKAQDLNCMHRPPVYHAQPRQRQKKWPRASHPNMHWLAFSTVEVPGSNLAWRAPRAVFYFLVWRGTVTNYWVRSKINFLWIHIHRNHLLETVKWRTIAWFGHVTRHDSLSKTILHGKLEGRRRRGRQRKCWMDNIKEWTSLPMAELPTMASRKKYWKKKKIVTSSGQPYRSRDWTELKWTSGDTALNVQFLLRGQKACRTDCVFYLRA